MARRVNRKFLIFLIGLSHVVGIAGVAGFWLRVKPRTSADVKELLIEADEATRAGDAESDPTNRVADYERAAKILTEARGVAADNTDVLVRLGDALDRLTGKDPIYLGQARIQWNKAVSVDPHCVPALRALLKSYADELEMSPRPAVFAEVKRVCDNLLNVLPDDLQAQEKKQIAIIREFRANQTVSTQDVQESVDNALPQLIRRDPENAELPRTLALARVEQARTALNITDNQTALFVLDEAVKMLDDARKGRENNVDMQFRAFQSYLMIKNIDPAVKTDKDKEKAYNDRINQCLDLARGMASKLDPAKDPLCDDIYQASAEWVSQQGKPEEAERIIREFYNAHKDDLRARLTIARVLENKSDAKGRSEAIAILSQKANSGSGMGGFDALVQRDLAAQTIAELIRIHMADYAALKKDTDVDKRREIDVLMEDELDQLRHLYPPESIPVLNLEGRLHMAKGENVEAVKTFVAAEQQLGATTSTADDDLLYHLAEAYYLTGQPGQARQRLEKVILKMDTAIPPRILLARILLQSNELAGLAIQVKKLQELAPEAPEVKQVSASLDLANHVHNPARAAAVYAQMPETNHDERTTKAQVAIALARNDEAVRLLEVVLKETPGDEQASLTLALVYFNGLGQKETAKRVIENALKLHPDEPILVDTDARLRDLLPDDIYQVVSKAVAKTKDPFTREMQMYDLESRPGGHPERAFGHLIEASKLKPDDLNVLNPLFAYYVNHGKFDQAGAVIEKLAAHDADQCGGLMYRYRLELVRGNLAAAEDIGHQLTQRYQEFAASWLVTAQVLQARGKFEEAKQHYLEVLIRQPGQYDAYNGLVECYYRLNDPESAESKLDEARGHYPDDPLLREKWLVHLVNFGKSALAIPERERMLAENKQRQKDQADDYLQLAKAYFHAAEDEAVTRPDQSAEHLNQAFQTLAQGEGKFPEEGRFAGQLAEMYQYNRDLEAGEKVLLALHDRDDRKNDPEPDQLLTEFYLRWGRFDKAEYYLNEALVRANAVAEGINDPKKYDLPMKLRLQLASLQAQEAAATTDSEKRDAKFKEATATLDGLGAAAKTDIRIIRQKLEIMIAQGRQDEARKGIMDELAKRDLKDELSKHDGTDNGDHLEIIGLHNLLASLMIDSRQLDQAVKELDHVLALDPKNDNAIYLQSLATARLGDVDTAVHQLIGVRNRDPRNAQVRLLMAELYNKSGKNDYAIRELEEGLQKIPTNRDIRLTLIQLYRAQKPMTAEASNAIVRLCTGAEADPVLRADPTWPREEAITYANMLPPDVPRAVMKWQQVIALAPEKSDFRREFVDLLIQFRDWNAVMNETDKLAHAGHNEWWLHFQRGMASAHLGNKDQAVAEFDKSLAATDARTSPAQEEGIIRGIGENSGNDIALQRLMPLLGNDPDARWRLLEASLLRSKGELEKAEQIVTTLMADPANDPVKRRAPLLRAKADICMARSAADVKDAPKSLAENLRARDAYVELLTLEPQDAISLNNLAYLLSEKIPPPLGGPQKAKEYSSKAYDEVRFEREPNIQIVDTQGWVLTLCGGDDAIEGLRILEKMIVERQDTGTFIEGRYHLGEAYLRAQTPNPIAAQKWLKEAMGLIAIEENAGHTIDAALKDKIQSALAKANGPITSSGR